MLAKLVYGAVEKVGHKWASTDFVVDAWGSEKDDVERQA